MSPFRIFNPSATGFGITISKLPPICWTLTRNSTGTPGQPKGSDITYILPYIPIQIEDEPRKNHLSRIPPRRRRRTNPHRTRRTHKKTTSNARTRNPTRRRTRHTTPRMGRPSLTNPKGSETLPTKPVQPVTVSDNQPRTKNNLKTLIKTTPYGVAYYQDVDAGGLGP